MASPLQPHYIIICLRPGEFPRVVFIVSRGLQPKIIIWEEKHTLRIFLKNPFLISENVECALAD